MKRTSKWIVLATGLVCCFTGAVLVTRYARAGGIPASRPLAYSGLLEDSTGAPLTGSHNVQVNLWTTATGGTAACTQPSTAIVLDMGRFSLTLPDACTGVVKANADVWVDVVVDGTSLGRSKLGAVPYSVEAAHATAADGATSATSATSAQIAGALGDNHSGVPHGFELAWTGSALQVWVDGTNAMTLNKSGSAKTFIIDHPTDPARYLVHATLEGPESAVYYRGTARLKDGRGEVALPAYFEAATRPEGRTVLLTPKYQKAAEAVSAIAASEVHGGSFSVRALDENNPEQAFDWEVKAVRADVAPLPAEPRRMDIAVQGDGPYKYFQPRPR